MRPIDIAKDHFSKRAARQIIVKDWVDEQGRPLEIWFNPMTVQDREHLLDLQKRHGTGHELFVKCMILHCRDSQGRPLFTLEDKHDLMNKVDPDIVTYIVGEMFADHDPEAIKKKSIQTPNSDSS